MAFVLPFLAPGLGAAFVEGVLAVLGITLVVGVATDPKVKESAKDAAAKVTQWLSSRREIDASSVDSHVMNKKHKFNDKCGAKCILAVAVSMVGSKSWTAEGSIPVVRGSGTCGHGCEIEVRISLPTRATKWQVGTAFHTGECKAVTK